MISLADNGSALVSLAKQSALLHFVEIGSVWQIWILHDAYVGRVWIVSTLKHLDDTKSALGVVKALVDQG